MSGDEQGFLAALKAEDGSDTREVYADWLEEHGEAERAEYLRIEAEVRSFDFITGDPEREAKERRHGELEKQLAKRSLDWLLEVRRKPRPRVRVPRPTDLGLAEVIPAPRPADRPDSDDASWNELAPRPLPLGIRELPPLKTQTSWGPSIIIGILVGIALIMLITDMSTPGFWGRVIERIYIDGHF